MVDSVLPPPYSRRKEEEGEKVAIGEPGEIARQHAKESLRGNVLSPCRLAISPGSPMVQCKKNNNNNKK